MEHRKVLITGFDPFGGETVNPAWEAVSRLDGRVLESKAGTGTIQIVAKSIPTVFGKSVDAVVAVMDVENPNAVICVGQAGGRFHITPERVAINVDDARIPDNDGNQPMDAPIVADGPAAYWSTLPLKRIVNALMDAGIPSSVSNSAGTYVCNHVFYGLMHHIQTNRLNAVGGFVHVPFLPEQVVDKSAPSMSLDMIVRGLETLIIATMSEPWQRD